MEPTFMSQLIADEREKRREREASEKAKSAARIAPWVVEIEAWCAENGLHPSIESMTELAEKLSARGLVDTLTMMFDAKDKREQRSGL